MARDFSRKFYNSKEWKQCRDGYIDSTIDRLCERCGEPGDEVHHIIYLAPGNINDPYITLSWDNLELLCQSCHSIQHNRKYKETIREGLTFNDRGDLVVVDSRG